MQEILWKHFQRASLDRMLSWVGGGVVGTEQGGQFQVETGKQHWHS